MRVVVLAGGTGGAKLAAGIADLHGSDLSVIANTGDDVEALGVHVSPDPDLCNYWLSGEIDSDRGWGIKGDSFTVFERMKQLGAPDWFGLSDRDLAACLERRRRMELGQRQTVAHAAIAEALGVTAAVLPMSDEPVRTLVRTPDGWREFQEYLVHDAAEPDIHEVRFDGIEHSRPTPEVAAALAAAEVIVVGPSNPVISIGPILAVPGMRELLDQAPAPVVAVSPFVAGKAIKGPTYKFMQAIGEEPSAAGIAVAYEGVIDGLVCDAADPDPPPASLPTLVVDTLMDGTETRRRLASEVLDFGRSLEC